MDMANSRSTVIASVLDDIAIDLTAPMQASSVVDISSSEQSRRSAPAQEIRHNYLTLTMGIKTSVFRRTPRRRLKLRASRDKTETTAADSSA
ncbi:MAG: hypothetical protein J0J10_10580 [Bosea sp.]|uniref:hypothetical protein n=1 Tax=Bosea sp. (in: a-proteobacteria) TaxID=1871050 RepID=UPI001ACAE6F3|nr:hypothetical protein [Bosea sp. (in: a-proteobacteria)]MBN9469206.1 hypothetical protein [Bosea sp. (in: a-proteobacteria)]